MFTYFDLADRLHEIATLRSVEALLGWDEQVSLPAGGTTYRAEQASLIAKLVHERMTDPRMSDMLSDVESAALDEDQRVVVRELRKDFDRATKLPMTLVAEMSKATVLSQAAWVDARKANDFAAFAPWLTRVLTLKRDEAACYGSPSGDPYDALLDTYEPGETAAGLRPLFDTLKPQLVALLNAVRDCGRVAPSELLHRPIAVDAQQRMTAAIASAVGFDADAGRLDISVHPFCTGIGARRHAHHDAVWRNRFCPAHC